MHVRVLTFLVLSGILFLLATSAGCTGSPRAVVPDPDSRMGSGNAPGSFYLYQNIVNTSLEGSGSDTADAVRAAAIRDALDSRNPVTRDFAVAIIPRTHGGPFNTAQACDLWEAVSSRWTYVDDPHGGDYFSPASRTIALGLRGDCDDFAIVMASSIEAVGGSARIVVARNGTFGHAYPEVYTGTTEEEFEAAAAYIRQRYQVTDIGRHVTTGPEGTRYWLNLDWWNGHPGGRFFADDGTRTACYPDGRWERVES
jgi:transglutaminase-like putative cysteine protease